MRLIIGALLGVLAVGIGDAEAPLNVGVAKQLFIDSRFVARSDNVELHMNPAQKMGRIVGEAGKPFHRRQSANSVSRPS